MFSGLYHTGTVNAGWSRPWLNFNGGTVISRGAGGAQPGSYYDRDNYFANAESSAFRWLGVLRFQWQRDQQNMFISTGLIDSTVNSWSAGLIRRKWAVNGGMSNSEGSHLSYGFVIPAWQHLPELVGVPLTSDPVDYTFISGSGQLPAGVRVNVSYRKNSYRRVAEEVRSHFDTLEVTANYHIGRMTFDAMYGRYLTGTENLSSIYDSSRYLWRFRIMRTFNWF
jgi:hypothetical protein